MPPSGSPVEVTMSVDAVEEFAMDPRSIRGTSTEIWTFTNLGVGR